MGLRPGNMKRWENGAAVNSETLEPTQIAPFNCSDIFRIANGFNVSITYLFTGR